MGRARRCGPRRCRSVVARTHFRCSPPFPLTRTPSHAQKMAMCLQNSIKSGSTSTRFGRHLRRIWVKFVQHRPNRPIWVEIAPNLGDGSNVLTTLGNCLAACRQHFGTCGACWDRRSNFRDRVASNDFLQLSGNFGNLCYARRLEARRHHKARNRGVVGRCLRDDWPHVSWIRPASGRSRPNAGHRPTDICSLHRNRRSSRMLAFTPPRRG